MTTFAIVFYLVLGYLLAGVSVATKVDEAQMREHVPFGDFPSMFTLQQIRAMVFVVMVIIGPEIFVEAFVLRVWVWLRVRIWDRPPREIGGTENGR